MWFGMGGRTLASALVLAALTCLVPPAQVTAVENDDPNYEYGNFWEYSFDASDEELRITGSVVMEIVRFEDYLIADAPHLAFVISTEGQGGVSGTVSGESVSGSITISATEWRLASNFDLVRSLVSTDMRLSTRFTSVRVNAGFDKTFSPAMNDHVAYDELTERTMIVGSTFVTGEEWFETVYLTVTDDISDNVPYSHEVTDVDVSKSTMAGTFSCYEIEQTSLWSDGDLIGTNYYSAEAGNYVIMDGPSSYFGGLLGKMTLTSYSYNPDPVPPVADAGADLTVTVGESFTLDGTASYDNVGIVLYSWEFEVDGDTETVEGPMPELIIYKAGEYRFTLTVYDDAGNQNSDFVTVEVERAFMAYLTGDNLWISLLLLAAAAGALTVVYFVAARRKKVATGSPAASMSTEAPPIGTNDPSADVPEAPVSPDGPSPPDEMA